MINPGCNGPPPSVGSPARKKKKGKRKMKVDRFDLDDLRRRLLQLKGMSEEWNAAMGWVITVSADPRPARVDVSADAAGWVRWRTLRARPRR
jgi:hypothetical protein